MSIDSVPAAAAGGFVMMPAAWLDLDVSPGARLLLVQFCRAANAEGASWRSYRQLGEILGRAPSTIQRYVDELRNVGVITTEKQQTKSSQNCRLRVFVVGWAEIRAAWRAMSKASRRRRDAKSRTAADATEFAIPGLPSGPEQTPDGGSTHEDVGPGGADEPPVSPSPNGDEVIEADAAPAHGRPAADPLAAHPRPEGERRPFKSVWTPGDERLYQAAGPRSDGTYDRAPDPVLHERLERAFDHAKECAGVVFEDDRKVLAGQLWKAFAAEKGIEGDASAMLARIVEKTRYVGDLHATFARIRTDWQDHWRKPPNAWQVEKQIVTVGPTDPDAFSFVKFLQSRLGHMRAWRRRQANR